MKINRFARNLLDGKFVELVHTGSFRASTGPVVLTDQHLQEIAEDYDKDFRVGTLSIGHPPNLMWGEINQGERPAHGVLAEVKKLGDVLYGRFENLTEEIKSDLLSGKWVNRSAELTRKHPETGRAYLTGLALLGVSQPAIPEMLASDDGAISILCESESESESTESDNQPPPLTKGASHMDAAELKRLEALELQAGEFKTLQSNITKLTDSVTELTTKVEGLSSLKTENEALSASLKALVDAQAQLAVDKATAGVPKELCPDEKKIYLAELYTTNRKMFDIEAQTLSKLRASTKVLTSELVADADGKPVNINLATDPEADERSKKIALKVRELREADKSLSIEQATKLAKAQVA